MQVERKDCVIPIRNKPMDLDLSRNSKALQTQVISMFKSGMTKEKIVNKLFKEKFFTWDDEKKEKIIEKYTGIVSKILKEAGLI